jgi:S-adenosylmethionine:tRNA ribosyltransferase-isomerase
MSMSETGMETDQYDYPLPKELIAEYPVSPRTDARLMVVSRKSGSIEHAYIRDLPDYIQPEDCMVLNDTRVIPAKLVGYRTSTKGRWHGLFLGCEEHGVWRLLCKTRGQLQPGDVIRLQNRKGIDDFSITMLARLSGGAWAVRPDEKDDWKVLLERVGQVPLPHYIRHGTMTDADLQDYQTVYAKKPGSVAAPTAGLHFTSELLRQLKSQGTSIGNVTLHVGLGTFRPISSPTLEAHEMHSEWGEITADTVSKIEACKQGNGRVIAIGTTSMRVLETAALSGNLQPWQGETNIFIRPGYPIRVVDALLTNFHLPRSTLLVLVRTFGGDDLMKEAYTEAIREKYRFFSYGDAMLIT